MFKHGSEKNKNSVGVICFQESAIEPAQEATKIVPGSGRTGRRILFATDRQQLVKGLSTARQQVVITECQNATGWPAQNQIRHRAKRKVGRVTGNPLRSATGVCKCFPSTVMQNNAKQCKTKFWIRNSSSRILEPGFHI